MSGFVYAIAAGDAIKLGWSSNPIRRREQLSTGSFIGHRLIGFVKATREQEQELHSLCSAHRIRGEWFRNEGVVSHFVSMVPLASMNKTRLQLLLEERDMNLSDLARAVEVDKATATRWSQGNIPPERVRDVASATGIPLHVLRPDLWDAPNATEAA